MAKVRKPLAAALGAAFLATSIAPLASAANLFSAQQLSGGYDLANYDKHGEGTCGGTKAEGEGNCGEGKKAEHEGNCGEGKKAESEGKCAEGRCAEGKCGAGKKAATEGTGGEGEKPETEGNTGG